MGDLRGEITVQKSIRNIRSLSSIYTQDFDDIWLHASSLVPNEVVLSTSKSAPDLVRYGVHKSTRSIISLCIHKF